MKYLFSLLFFVILCGSVYAQETIKVVGDTTDLKTLTWNRPVILLQYGGSPFNRQGGGIFQRIDSTYGEGTHAFDHPWSGSQWSRLQYSGDPAGVFQDITTVDDATIGDDLVVTDDADIGGDITLQLLPAFMVGSVMVFALLISGMIVNL